MTLTSLALCNVLLVIGALIDSLMLIVIGILLDVVCITILATEYISYREEKQELKDTIFNLEMDNYELASGWNDLVEKIYDRGLQKELFGEERVIDYRDEEM